MSLAFCSDELILSVAALLLALLITSFFASEAAQEVSRKVVRKIAMIFMAERFKSINTKGALLGALSEKH